MEISYSDMGIINAAMGKHADLLQVVGSELHLHWWTNEGSDKLVVEDFSGHRDYFDNFIKVVLEYTNTFNNRFGDPLRIDSDRYLNLRKVYLGE